MVIIAVIHDVVAIFVVVIVIDDWQLASSIDIQRRKDVFEGKRWEEIGRDWKRGKRWEEGGYEIRVS